MSKIRDRNLQTALGFEELKLSHSSFTAQINRGFSPHETNSIQNGVGKTFVRSIDNVAILEGLASWAAETAKHHNNKLCSAKATIMTGGEE